MDIKEIKLIVKEASEDIKSIIESLEIATNTTVQVIYIQRDTIMNGSKVSNVKLDISL